MSSKVHSDISCETKEISQDDVQEIKNLIEERIFLSLQSDYKRCKGAYNNACTTLSNYEKELYEIKNRDPEQYRTQLEQKIANLKEEFSICPTTQEIIKRHHKQSWKYHPDRHPEADPEQVQELTEKMAEINEMKQNKMLCKEIEKLTFWKEYFDCIEQLRYPEKALIKAENNVAQQQIKCEELYQKMQEANEKFISSSKYDEQK